MKYNILIYLYNIRTDVNIMKLSLLVKYIIYNIPKINIIYITIYFIKLNMI